MKLRKIQYTESLPETYSYALTDSLIKTVFNDLEDIALFKTHGKFSFDSTFPQKKVTYPGDVLFTLGISYAYKEYPKKNIYLHLFSSKLKIRIEGLTKIIDSEVLPVAKQILAKEEASTRQNMLVLTYDGDKYRVYEEAWG